MHTTLHDMILSRNFVVGLFACKVINCDILYNHDDVIKWKHFPRYQPFVRGIQRSPVNSPHKGQWRGAFIFSLIYAWINGWVNNRGAGDSRCHRAHYDVTVMGLHFHFEKIPYKIVIKSCSLDNVWWMMAIERPSTAKKFIRNQQCKRIYKYDFHRDVDRTKSQRLYNAMRIRTLPQWYSYPVPFKDKRINHARECIMYFR